ncbi:MAG: hypothetical protein ACFFCW_17660 [Candidatus Hodarchaeota archaeon]
MNISAIQRDTLKDIINSLETTKYGQAWPSEYNEFFRLWGFFNRIYDTLYTGAEWQRIAQFALDKSFSHIWESIKGLKALEELSRQPCVGDGRNDYVPSDHVRIAFHILRAVFNIDVRVVCQSQKCQKRKQQNWQICESYDWPQPPKNVTSPNDAIYLPLGATLAIIYQIRNNLFHGSKYEITGPDYLRNLHLINSSKDIMQQILKQTKETVSKF